MNNSKIKVLVVEDDFLVRMGIVDSLIGANFEVFEAASADDALETLQTHPDIQAMFTDIDMPPGMDGLKLAIAVRHRWPPIHIVIASGQVRMSQASMPVTGRFFSKPYNSTHIAQTLRDMVLNG